MSSKRILGIFIALIMLFMINTAIMAKDSNHYSLKTVQGCCTVDVDYNVETGEYTITYNDHITDYDQTVIETTKYDADWTIAEMITDYCNQHDF